jgi:5-methyltetrahydrofolate--homocysteine methyltransferase
VLACNNYEVIDLGVMVPCDKILAAAREKGADIIGLSGLITPSLDEMVHVAKEMERQGFTKIPLLIGGATTSPRTPPSRSRPHYAEPSCTCSTPRAGTRVYSTEAGEIGKQKAISNTPEGPDPQSLQLKAYSLSLNEIADFIDWGPFFSTWELHGRFPDILQDPVVGEEATKLYAEAQAMLKRIIDEKRYTAKAVIGFWPANAVGDSVEVYADESRSKSLKTFHFLRQQNEKPAGQFNHCLADFIAPKDSGRIDYLGGFAVTAGHGVDEFAAEFRAQHDDFNAILAQALGDRLAEALAELMHKKARDFSNYGKTENLEMKDIIREKYRGIRPAPGYPACPDHTEKPPLFDLLNATALTGITLTESNAMHPASSVSGMYFNHPDSKYFAVGKLAKDQLEDFGLRKSQSLDVSERWLAPYLDY